MDKCKVPPLPTLKTNMPGKVAKAKCMSQCWPDNNDRYNSQYNKYKDIVYTTSGMTKKSWRNTPSGTAAQGSRFCQATGPYGYYYEGRSMNIVQLRTNPKALSVNSFDMCTKMGFMPLCRSNDENAATGKCLFIGELIAGNNKPWGAKKLFPGHKDSTTRYKGWYNKHFACACAYPEASESKKKSPKILCNSYMTTDKTRYSNIIGGWGGEHQAVTCVSPQYGAAAKKKN